MEIAEGLPPSKMLNGHYDAVFTANGDPVVGLEYRVAKYVVWKAGEKTVGPVRELPRSDVLAHASPTMVLRGLGGSVPESTRRAART